MQSIEMVTVLVQFEQLMLPRLSLLSLLGKQIMKVLVMTIKLPLAQIVTITLTTSLLIGVMVKAIVMLLAISPIPMQPVVLIQ